MSNINTDGQKVWKLAKTQDIIKLSTGVGDNSMKLSNYGISATFAYHDADCSWRLVPKYFTQFSLNNITDEQWQSFATIDEIESKVKSLNSIGNKAETALAFSSIVDAVQNIHLIRRIGMNKWKDLGSSGGSRNFRTHELDGIYNFELSSGRRFKPSSTGKGDFEDIDSGKIIDHLGIGDGFSKSNLSRSENIEQFKNSIDKHFKKLSDGVDELLVDLNGFSKNEVSDIKKYISVKHSENAAKANIITK